MNKLRRICIKLFLCYIAIKQKAHSTNIALSIYILSFISIRKLEHAFGVYLQLQKWLGNDDFDVTQWRWKVSDNMLMPVIYCGTLDTRGNYKKISYSCAGACKSKVCDCKKKFPLYERLQTL